MNRGGECIVTDKLALLDCLQLLPIVNILCSSVTRTLLLCLQLLLKALQIDTYTLLASNEFGKVDGETKCIVQLKGILTCDNPVFTHFGNYAVQQIDTCSQCTQE